MQNHEVDYAECDLTLLSNCQNLGLLFCVLSSPSGVPMAKKAVKLEKIV